MSCTGLFEARKAYDAAIGLIAPADHSLLMQQRPVEDVRRPLLGRTSNRTDSIWLMSRINPRYVPYSWKNW